MPAALNEVKRRISSTQKTSQITTAMQMVSTSKLSQIQRHTSGYQVYASKVESVVTHLAASHLLDSGNVDMSSTSKNDDVPVSGLMTQRPVKKTGLLVVTSDRGLVGSYNSNIIKSTNDFINEHGKTPDDYVIMAVGGMGADFFKKRGMNVAYEYRGVSDVPTFVEVREIVKTVTAMYNNEVFDELYVCYSHFVNRLTSRFRSTRMLPITGDTIEDTKPDGDEVVQPKTAPISITPEYELEPSAEEILQVVLPQYAESLVYGAILDGKTSEHASSATAMQTASDNAHDLIDSLSLQYNRARQSAITTEITEITGGQAALE
ncbi:MAG: F0F1 ATP synthase subunit gamma [Furfurilactobacillus sp.]|jgi:F-type H+-transporting ATPase subunit gamma|uniref:ATP synthase gamma chain n=3 Tax=Furfurilactobacillus TaxID=2767882 RepID=A0A0R1RBU8_9LACO|nr:MULTISPECIES: F0F1 ATP synthase subunit gamma [Furfurilactobacillus]KRL54220.1 ATP synthase F0F1 subunit gamma [Furfurilactobacillus rossiae DSM 15814]MCF6161235.1 F0F1 ATP synthase subunit gamma [Furfurilactobacillus milii]MCF6163615.1 F0F1 ATP synthase subunit gamma [Furfurilactobacillus milii]MCF6166404.1 F0F1 ATP synthase subunit gamma [Furfurilactobacillus rossiae]MCF6419014.1 F0F1 ATP synthase subunit gamma [Furfurilactobacillus milii]